MTREEAINLIDINRSNLKATNEEGFSKDIEALDMAIEALSKVNKIKEIIAIDNMVIQEDVLKYKMICEVLE